MKRVLRAALLLALGIALLSLSDASFLYYRDNFSTHHPIKSITPEIIRDGLPLWNPSVGGGQPLAGNPNHLTFYPTTLLFLFLPSHVAFNLHFLIHLCLGWFGIRRLVRLYDLDEELGGLVSWIYILSGTTISCLVFFNLVVAAGLMPWALGSLVRLLREPSRRDTLGFGSLCGLIGLAAEPVTAGGFAILALFVLGRHFSRRRAGALVVAGAISLLVASPQLIAYYEISGELERAHFPYTTETSLAASLGPDRLVELFLGPIYGSVLDHSSGGYWANQDGRRWPPFFPSVISTALLIPSLLRRGRKDLLFYQLPLLLFLLLSLGRFNPLLPFLLERFELLGVIRYPEKFALLITLAGAVPIALFVGELRIRPDAFRKPATLGIVAILMMTGITLLFTDSGPAAILRICGTSALQILPLLLLVAPARVPHLPRLICLLALVPLGYWATRTIPLDHSRYYTVPSPVATVIADHPVHVRPARVDWDAMSSRALYRFYAFRLEPVSAIRFSIRYALSDSPDGMHSYLSGLASERARQLPPEISMRYLRIHGAAFTVRSEPITTRWTSLTGRWNAWGAPVLLYAIEGSRPLVWEPRSILRVKHASAAAAMIESQRYDPSRDTVAPDWLDPSIRPTGSATVEVLSRNSQEMDLQVETPDPTVLIVNQTWFSAWRVTREGRELTTFPADIDRLGVVIPAGKSSIHVSLGRHRPLIGVATALSLLVLLYAAGSTIWSRRRSAVPAR